MTTRVDEPATAKPFTTIRIVVTDTRTNRLVGYVHHTFERWSFMLANGSGAHFSYAGLSGEQAEVFFAFLDCEEPDELAYLCETRGDPRYTYTLE
jgi:hypothetical protein